MPGPRSQTQPYQPVSGVETTIAAPAPLADPRHHVAAGDVGVIASR